MKLKNFSTRVLKQDCLDLPEKTYTVRYVSMTDEQRKHYVIQRDCHDDCRRRSCICD